MDRQIIDDIFCFNSILQNYLHIEIERIKKSIHKYHTQICIYQDLLIETDLKEYNKSAIEHGIFQNQKRIVQLNDIINDYRAELIRLNYICNKYFYEKNFMATNFIEKNFNEHSDLIQQAFFKAYIENINYLN